MLIRGGAPPWTRPVSTDPSVNHARSLPPPVCPALQNLRHYELATTHIDPRRRLPVAFAEIVLAL
jgi:hypothetical protein